MCAKENLTKEEISEFDKAFGEPVWRKRKPEAQVRPYDFGEPDKLSKLNLRALQFVFSSLERPWSAELSSAVKSRSSVEMHPVHQATFGSYAEHVRLSETIFQLKMDSLPGPMFIGMPMALAASIVDGMAGGNGEVESLSDSLTRIQREILKKLIARMASSMEKAWKPITDVKISIAEILGSLHNVDLDASEPMLIVGSSWQVNDIGASVSIAFPMSALEPVIDLLDPQRWVKGGAAPKSTSTEPISKLLKAVDMSVSVQLGEARLSVRDVLGMEEGDVIRLNSLAGDPLQVKVGGQPRFFARPGLVGKKLSAQIVDNAKTSSASDDIDKERM